MAVPEAADRAELSTIAITRLLASDMREELLTGRRRLIGKHHLEAFLAGEP
jgi:hypothetical protein